MFYLSMVKIMISLIIPWPVNQSLADRYRAADHSLSSTVVGNNNCCFGTRHLLTISLLATAMSFDQKLQTKYQIFTCVVDLF